MGWVFQGRLGGGDVSSFPDDGRGMFEPPVLPGSLGCGVGGLYRTGPEAGPVLQSTNKSHARLCLTSRVKLSLHATLPGNRLGRLIVGHLFPEDS